MDENSEQNTARLIRISYDRSARPTVEASEETLNLMLEHVRAPVATGEFPDLVVGLLGGMLAIVVAWLIVRMAWGGASFSTDPALAIVGGWAIVNLAVIPIAGLVILTGRKHG